MNKKTNWLVVSYIAFLFICAFVRFFYDYPLWDTLVIAVTISGGFLTYSESFDSSAEYLKKSLEDISMWR